MRITLTLLLFALIALPVSMLGSTNPGNPDKYDSVTAATSSALQTGGLLRAEEVVLTSVAELSSQTLSAHHSRHLYLVTFMLRSGEKLEAIARIDESPVAEQSGLVVYVVSKILQPDGKAVPVHP